MNRRSFIAGLLATPALVRANSLDFVPRARLLLPEYPPVGTLINLYGKVFKVLKVYDDRFEVRAIGEQMKHNLFHGDLSHSYRHYG